jgi:hypothetical protein
VEVAEFSVDDARRSPQGGVGDSILENR